MLSIKSLRTKKSRDALGVFIVEGERFVKEIPENYRVVQYIVSNGYKKPTGWLVKRADVVEVSKAVFDRFAETSSPQGIAAVVQKIGYTLDDGAGSDGFVLVCDGLGDPANLGGLIRTAAAAVASCVVLTNECASIWNPKVQRASAGAALRIPVVDNTSINAAAEYAKKHGMPIYGAHPRGESLPYDLNLATKFCLIVGSEAHGLSQEAIRRSDKLVRLPMGRGAESLSAAVAGSIIMYEAIRQREVRLFAKLCRG